MKTGANSTSAVDQRYFVEEDKNKMAAVTGFWNRRGILNVFPADSLVNACKENVDSGNYSNYALELTNLAYEETISSSCSENLVSFLDNKERFSNRRPLKVTHT